MLLACVFEKIIKVSINEYDFNAVFSVELPGYTSQCRMKNPDNEKQTLQDTKLLFEYLIQGAVSNVMSDRSMKSEDNKKILHIDANKVYGPSMSQSLPYDEIKFDRNVQLENIITTPDDGDIG